jgi:DNA-directed RNA polymerase specialized sigma24 family protein
VNTYASWWRRRWRGELPTQTVPERPAPDEYSAADDRAALAVALGRLPHRQRITIVLRFHEDMTEVAVAAAMHCSVGTLKSR